LHFSKLPSTLTRQRSPAHLNDSIFAETIGW
jgi:hypothetical protein